MIARYYPVKSRTASEAIRVLKLLQQADCTPIQHIKSDQEACLKTTDFQEFCKQMGITHRHTAVNNPQSNGFAEVQTKFFKKSVRILAQMMDDEWDQNLHLLTLSQSKVIKQGTQLTAEAAHFGFITPSNFTITGEPVYDSLPKVVKEQQEKVRKIREETVKTRLEQQERKRDPRIRYKPGDVVMHMENPIKAQATIKLRNSGPYRIDDKQEEDSFSVWCTNLNTGQRRKLPMSSLSRYKAENPIMGRPFEEKPP
jgi:hypothetical protein